MFQDLDIVGNHVTHSDKQLLILFCGRHQKPPSRN